MKTIRKYILGFAAVLAVSVATAQPAKPDLVGRVANPDGSPITNATVLIYTASPLQRTSSLCPSCYSDCRKQTVTGTNGNFEIKSLDSTLLFRLLVLAPNHESTFIDKVNPASGAVDATLKSSDSYATPPDLRIEGLVIADDGQPVAGATIQVRGVGLDNGGQQWGRTGRLEDATVVSDARGRFLLRCTSKVQVVYAMVSARGAAPRSVQLTPGRDCLVRLQEGVRVTGRVVVAGRPVPGAVIGASLAVRTSGEFFTSDKLATDGDGRFSLLNLPPEKALLLYGTMNSLQEKGTLSPKPFATGKNQSTSDVGDLVLDEGFQVAGRIVLADGALVPARSRLLLVREGASDSAEFFLDADGRFEFKGVPAETIGLSLRLNGYKFSPRNPSLDWANGRILGKVDGDITNLTLLLEPGEFRFSPKDVPEGVDPQPRDKPLRGVNSRE
jgi:hypothetical protein